MTAQAKVSEWLDARGLDPELAAKMGWVAAQHRDLGLCLKIPYMRDGKVATSQYRRLDAKEFRFAQGSDVELWNVDCLRDETLDDCPLVMAEGACDGLALMQCGFVRVVAVPGWSDKNFDPERYEPFKRNEDLIGRAKMIVVAQHDDNAGAAMLHGVANFFNESDVRYVRWPKGCKDANDTLLLHGPDAVVQAVNGAKAVDPPGGLITGFTDLPPQPDRQIFRLDYPEVDRLMAFRTREFSVLTGTPSSGKTTFATWVAHHIVRALGVRVGLALFETEPIEVQRHLMRLNGFDLGMFDRAKNAQAALAELDRHYRLVHRVDEGDQVHGMAWLKAIIHKLAARDGCKFIIIDPWNELEHVLEPGEQYTYYLNLALMRLRQWADRYDIHIMVLAHPKKMDAGRKPLGYDIDGCHDPETEVLTERGWVPHPQVTRDDMVACFDPERGDLRYERPMRIIRREHDGEMVRLRGQQFDLLVTPDHRMVVRPRWLNPVGGIEDTGRGRPEIWPKSGWSFVNASDLPSAPFEIPLAAPHPGGADVVTIGGHDYAAEPFAQFIGYWLAEGYPASSGIGLCQAPGAVANAIEANLLTLGIVFTVSHMHAHERLGDSHWQPTRRWYIGARGNADLIAWVKANCGEGCASNKIPAEAFGWSPTARRALLEAYIDGDGYRPAYGMGAKASTTSPALRDGLQRLAIECGLQCNWSARHPAPGHSPSWELHFDARNRSVACLRAYRHAERVPYRGEVFCLEVPTGAYVTRRNGKAQISGNSAAWANKPGMGYTIHMESDESRGDHVSLTTWKVRSRQDTGCKPGVLRLSFNEETMVYRPI